MLVYRNWSLNAENLDAALRAATPLFNGQWLTNQRRIPPNSHLTQGVGRAIPTWGQIDHAIKHSLAGRRMHPLAEALIASETALAEFSKTGAWFENPIFYRVISLGQIASHCSFITGIEPRVARLIGTDWKSTLYGLLVACSYHPETPLEFVKETNVPTPD